MRTASVALLSATVTQGTALVRSPNAAVFSTYLVTSNARSSAHHSSSSSPSLPLPPLPPQRSLWTTLGTSPLSCCVALTALHSLLYCPVCSSLSGRPRGLGALQLQEERARGHGGASTLSRKHTDRTHGTHECRDAYMTCAL